MLANSINSNNNFIILADEMNTFIAIEWEGSSGNANHS